MKKTYLIITGILCVISETLCANTNTKTAHVINDTNQPIQVGFTVPEHHRADIEITKNKSLQEVLYAAILKDSAEEIRAAVKAGVDINKVKDKDGRNPIVWAILLSKSTALETLLQLGAKPDDQCGQHAMKMQNAKSLLMLIRYNQFNLNIQEVVGLISSTIISQQFQVAMDLMKELISRGYDINEFWAPVIMLAHYRKVAGEEMIRFLLFRGANPNHTFVRRNGIQTPLYIAGVDWPNKEVVKILIEAGANINQKLNPYHSDDHRSLLSWAIERNSGASSEDRHEIINILLEHGATL